MKNTIITVLISLLITVSSFAQQGINYKALIKDDNGNALVNTNNVSVQFTIYEGVALTNQVYQETHTNVSTDANGILISTIGGGNTSDVFSDISWGNDEHWLNVQIDIGDGLVDVSTTQFMAVPYALSAGNVNGLERVTDSIDSSTGLPIYGWRLKGRDASVIGKIGRKAVDLSHATSAFSMDTGATGEFSAALNLGVASGRSSIAMGQFTRAIGEVSTAMGYRSEAIGVLSTAMGVNTVASGGESTTMGSYVTAPSFVETTIGRLNTAYTPNNAIDWDEADRLFTIGNGSYGDFEENLSDALIVLKNGTITAPSFDLSEITDDKALITKEYADENLIGSGLEKITENGNTGWRILGRDPLNYNDIGSYAVDLSYSQLPSSTNGASSFASFTSGLNTEASGSYSVAMGNSTMATRSNSTVFGAYNVENANTIFAIGNGSPGFDVPERKNALTLNVGIGNSVDFIIGNHQINDDPLTSNDDIKFFFSGQYGALRVGKVSNETGDEWNEDNIGFYSTAFGTGTIAFGGSSFAAGNKTNASGIYSTALGSGTIASTASSIAVGSYNIDDTDAQFMVGNGTNISRKSAFIVKKDGEVLAPDFQISQITDDKALITKEYFDFNSIISINNLTDGKSDADGSSLFLGIDAGLNDDGSDNRNVGVGSNALSFNTSGYRNTSIGNEALLNNTSGFSNTATGSGALIANIEGDLNTAIGNNALISNTSGNSNTALGASAGIANNSGTGNVYLGRGAGGTSLNENNKLYINNTQSSFPLIYGEFDTDLIRIYGTFEVTEEIVADVINTDIINTEEIRTAATGNANLIPIAYGTIESNANVLSGTGNFTASITANVITISVNNETMNHFNTSCSITPYSTSFRTSSIIITGGDIEVRTFNSSGSLAPVTFQFVIYKL